ncbi:hypothetical protein [Lentzea indica]|nr:hypothetical protein [Lentzea indica]
MAAWEHLRCLPLTIEQAGAYTAETGPTPVEYLDILSHRPHM